MTTDQEYLAEDIIIYTKVNNQHFFHLGQYVTNRKNNGQIRDEYVVKAVLDQLYIKGLLTKMDEKYGSHLTPAGSKWISFEDERKFKLKSLFYNEVSKNLIYPILVALIVGLLFLLFK